jgi:hypothetical protein
LLLFQYEIIFCVQEPDDTRLKMYIDSLRAKYPKVEAQVSGAVCLFLLRCAL